MVPISHSKYDNTCTCNLTYFCALLMTLFKVSPGSALHEAKQLLSVLACGLKHCSNIDTGTTTGSSGISVGFCGMGMSL